MYVCNCLFMSLLTCLQRRIAFRAFAGQFNMPEAFCLRPDIPLPMIHLQPKLFSSQCFPRNQPLYSRPIHATVPLRDNRMIEIFLPVNSSLPSEAPYLARFLLQPSHRVVGCVDMHSMNHQIRACAFTSAKFVCSTCSESGERAKFCALQPKVCSICSRHTKNPLVRRRSQLHQAAGETPQRLG